ncbi:MAG TPA: hypothetical protein VGW10_11450, partial [Solirubrobacteraceae bacterium]|nr:hypothetical protein [Solirubrobacteraceae bacterium]
TELRVVDVGAGAPEQIAVESKDFHAVEAKRRRKGTVAQPEARSWLEGALPLPVGFVTEESERS